MVFQSDNAGANIGHDQADCADGNGL